MTLDCVKWTVNPITLRNRHRQKELWNTGNTGQGTQGRFCKRERTLRGGVGKPTLKKRKHECGPELTVQQQQRFKCSDKRATQKRNVEAEEDHGVL